MSLRHRPRSAAELVDAAVRLAAADYLRLITIGALFYIPPALVRVFGLRPSPTEEGTPAFGAADLMLTVHDIAWQSLGWAAMLIVLADRYTDERASAGAALRRVHADAWRIALVSVGASLLSLLGLALLILPGLYAMARFFAVPQTLLFERTTMGESISRSLSLSRQDLRRIFIAGTLSLMVSFGSWSILNAVIRPYVPDEWVAGLIAGVLQLPLEPVLAAFWLLLYFDVRSRVEGWDLQKGIERLNR